MLKGLSAASALERLPPEAQASIAEHLLALYSPAIPAADLEIAAGHRAWSLALDVIVAAADGGSVLDAAALAARAALNDLRIPETQATTIRGPEAKDANAAMRVEAGRRAGHFELVSHHELGRSLATAEHLPVAITASLVGTDVLIDADEVEAATASSALAFGVHPSGAVTHLRQTGDGELEWSTLVAALKVRAGLDSG